MKNATLRGKPDAGNPHVRFDEGEVAPENPRRGSLLYNKIGMFGLVAGLAMSAFSVNGEEISGTVDLNGADAAYAGITGSGKLCNTSETMATVTLTPTVRSDFTGTIEGNIKLVVNDATASQGLGGVNTYTAGTEVRSGALVLVGGTIGTGALKLCDNSKLTFEYVVANKNNVIANDIEISNSGRIGVWQQYGGGWNGEVQFTGRLKAVGATLQFVDGGSVKLTQPLSADDVSDFTFDAYYTHIQVPEYFFGTSGSLVDATVKLSEGNSGAPSRITLNGPQELPKQVIVTGGSIVCSGAVLGGVADNAKGALERPFAKSAIVFNGTLKTDVNLTFKGGVFSLPSGSRQASFDIKTGKTVTLNGALQSPADGTAKGFVKAGGGTLKITGAIGAEDKIEHRAGVLEFGREAYLANTGNVEVATGALFRMDDGVRTTLAPKASAESFLASANVWFDATRLTGTEGATVSSVANLGTAGGNFTVRGSGTPTYSAAGINGRAALKFNGSNGLRLVTYTNQLDVMTVFLVFKWDSWAASGGNGRWSGPLTLGTRTSCSSDYQEERFNPGVFGISFGSSSFSTFTRYYDCDRSTSSWSAKSYDLTHGAQIGDAILLADRRNGDVFEDVVTWPTADGTASSDESRTLAGASAQNIDTVAIGCRMLMTGEVSSQRGLIGKVGELIVFSRALSDDERDYVESYLKNKWLVSGAEAKATAGSIDAAVEIDAPSGSSEVRLGSAGKTAVAKTGDGDMTLVGKVSQVTKLESDAGGLQVRGSDVTSRAAVWIDATDTSTLEFATADRILKVHNKGFAGGCLTHCGVSIGYTENGINGRASMVFSGNQAGTLRSTDMLAWAKKPTQSRSLHIYGVFRRDAHSAYGTPFSTYLQAQGYDYGDQSSPGSFHWEEGTADTYTMHFGTDSKANCQHASAFRGDFVRSIADGTPYLFVTHQTTNMLVAAFETAADTDKQSVTWLGRGGCSLSPLNVDILVLGARIIGGIPSHQTWKGAIAELIMFDRQLTQAEETQLLAYLRTKWFTAGAELPSVPACLKPGDGADGFASAAEVTLSGTKFVDSLPEQTIGALSVADSELCREGSVAKFFDVTGEAAFEGEITVSPIGYPSGVTKLITYGSTAGTATWKLPTDARRNTIVENRASEKAVVLDHSIGFTVIVR